MKNHFRKTYSPYDNWKPNRILSPEELMERARKNRLDTVTIQYRVPRPKAVMEAMSPRQWGLYYTDWIAWDGNPSESEMAGVNWAARGGVKIFKNREEDRA